MGVLLDQLALIVSTPEVARLLSEAQLKGYLELIERPPSELLEALKRETPEWDQEELNEWSQMIAEWIEHFLTQPEVSLWVTEIQRQLIEDLGDKSLTELVGGSEAAQTFKRALIELISPHVKHLSETDEFALWCENYLSR